MIHSFDGQLAQDLFFDRVTAVTRRFPSELRKVAQRKLQAIHSANDLRDLRVPPGNRLKALQGDLKGQHSIRINDQWRMVFRWDRGAHRVSIADYH